MSLIEEIQSQKPAVRHTLFVLSLIVALAVVGYFGISALQREMYAILHTQEEQEQFAARQHERLPNPLAAILDGVGSLTASIGSLLGFDSGAGFDRGGQADNNQQGVYLLPLSR